MATHKNPCVVCGTQTLCSSEEGVLGAGAACFPEDGKMPIEFCSVKCFNRLRRVMSHRAKIAAEMHPDWRLELDLP